jgi:hypothetical protein
MEVKRFRVERPRVRRNRREAGVAKQGFLDVAPEFVVEVLAPHDSAEGLVQKLREHFAIVVRLVWVADPGAPAVSAYRSFTDVREIRETDRLSGDDVLQASRSRQRRSSRSRRRRAGGGCRRDQQAHRPRQPHSVHRPACRGSQRQASRSGGGVPVLIVQPLSRIPILPPAVSSASRADPPPPYSAIPHGRVPEQRGDIDPGIKPSRGRQC